jgi:hypothetical protein
MSTTETQIGQLFEHYGKTNNIVLHETSPTNCTKTKPKVKLKKLELYDVGQAAFAAFAAGISIPVILRTILTLYRHSETMMFTRPGCNSTTNYLAVENLDPGAGSMPLPVWHRLLRAQAEWLAFPLQSGEN